MILSSTLKMPGRAGNSLTAAGSAATLGSTGRKPYWTNSSCDGLDFTYWMNLFARSLFELFWSTAIGSWISIVWRGITYWMSLPSSRALIASLSYVIRTSPLPERNVFVAFAPEVSCETTCWKSFCTYAVAWASVLPSRRCAP